MPFDDLPRPWLLAALAGVPMTALAQSEEERAAPDPAPADPAPTGRGRRKRSGKVVRLNARLSHQQRLRRPVRRRRLN